MVSCPNCGGQGDIEGPPGTRASAQRIATCPTCEGEGEVVEEIAGSWDICDECVGWGEVGTRVAPQTCPSCKGYGMISRGRGRVPE